MNENLPRMDNNFGIILQIPKNISNIYVSSFEN